MRPHILVAGPMGVGKSTMAAALSDHLHLPLYLESAAERNPYLERFYTDMQRWAFASQTFFLCEALAQQQRIAVQEQGAVQDRSVWEHLNIFASGLYRGGQLTAADVALLEQIVQLGLRDITAPDLMIYLHADQKTISERIASRGRSYEQTISEVYLADHIAAYDSWISGFAICPILNIDARKYDPRRARDLKAIAHLINETLPQDKRFEQGP